jgi:hypothetical protein
VSARILIALIGLAVPLATPLNSAAQTQGGFERFVQVSQYEADAVAGKVRSRSPRCYRGALVRGFELSRGNEFKVIRSLGTVRTDRFGRWQLEYSGADQPGLYRFVVKRSSFRKDGVRHQCGWGQLEVRIEPTPIRPFDANAALRFHE